jgi:nucleoid-associated protein YgaU
VVRGDTLAAIAKRYYGDPNRWRQIAAANHVTDPATLRIGVVLTIP